MENENVEQPVQQQVVPEEQNVPAQANQPQEKIDSLEWVQRLVSHVVGGSVLVLPYAMSHAGIFSYCVILLLEVYFIFQSFIYLCEVVAEKRSSFGDENTNYFTIVEKCFSRPMKSHVHTLISTVFISDVVVCTAYYFKATGELAESFMYPEPLPEQLRPGYFATVYIIAACFVVGFDLVEKNYFWKTSRHRMASVSLRHCEIGTLVNVQDGDAHDESDPPLDMKAVVKETHTYSWKRSFLLFLVMCFTFVIFVICFSLWKDPDVMIAQNTTGQCSGIMQPAFWNDLDSHIFHVIPAIIFALMNYVIILPICTRVLGLPRQEYVSLINKSRTTLVLVYTGLPFMAVCALGGFVPVFFPTAFGYTIYGQLLTFVSLMITLTGMLLRVVACCKLIQVLFCKPDDNSNDQYWVIVIFLFFVSFAIASVVPSAIHLVIIAGSFNCNLLLIIIPRLAYINFKMHQTRFQIFLLQFSFWNIFAEWIGILWAIIGILIHGFLLLKTFTALQIVDPHVGTQCRLFFNQYWSS